MTDNIDHQRENEELIERLMTEKSTRSSVTVVTNNSEEWDHDHAFMWHHAARAILTELVEHRPPAPLLKRIGWRDTS